MNGVRREDVPCRYGGEEFALILPELPPDAAVARAEHLRLQVQGLFGEAGAIGTVTASFGVACFPSHGATGEAVVRAADAALYRAKHLGRNRVAVAEGGEPAPAAAPPDSLVSLVSLSTRA